MSRILAFFAALSLVGAVPGPVRADDVQALLRKADAFRLADGAMEVDTQLETFKAGLLDKERRYQVFVRPGRRSLVLSRSPVEKGQKVLMLEDDFWMVLPSSQRPIRIAPAQKLLGDAAAGDVATMAWADDYEGTVAGEEVVDGLPCLRLDLTARRRGVTYARVQLWLARADAHPVQANLYVASDKLAKQATFALERIDGRLQVSSMTLVDQIQVNRKTVIRYLARRPRTLPDEFFNPMFLARNEPRE
jgi:Outer membrane lipoprotein-sorting protein